MVIFWFGFWNLRLVATFGCLCKLRFVVCVVGYCIGISGLAGWGLL